MSGKRSLKKQQKRQASALEQLEELVRRGAKGSSDASNADDELLARAADLLPDAASSPFGPRWAAAADRALRQSLGRADFGRIERLLRAIRRSGGGARPLAVLSEAVLDVAAGRREAARSRLAALSSRDAAAATALPPRLLPALDGLTGDGFRGGGQPYLRAAQKLFRALQSFDRKALARSVQALRAAVPGELAQEQGLCRLLDAVDLGLSQLAALAALETKLARPAKRPKPPSQAVLAWLRAPGARLAAALTPGPPHPLLLAPLQHAVRMRWRAILEQVAEREGSAGLAALCAADPKLLALDVDLPGGVPAGSTAVRQRFQARQALAAGRYGELVDLLQSRSRTASEPSSLAALWSLELWARERQEIGQDDDEALAPGPFEPSPHKTLLRLQGMAGEIGRRFPASQRAEVARALRGELFDLCEQIPFCEHVAGAALSLLEHQPGDAGLLVAGLAGAAGAGDRHALRPLQARAANAKVQAADRADVDRLLVQVAQEKPTVLVPILDALRPLFPAGDWPRAAALVARELAGTFADVLREMSLEALRRPAAELLSGFRATLDLLRPALAGTPGFAAVELALDCWRQDRPKVERRLQRFLADVSGVERPLAAFRLLEMATGPWNLPSFGSAASLLANTVIDRLDEPWQLWCRDAPILAIAADGPHRQALEQKLQQILASPHLGGDDRENLTAALKAVQQVNQLKKLLQTGERRRRRPAKPKKKPRRRSAGPPQLELDLP